MMDVIIEQAVKVAACLLITLIGVFGTWLSLKVGKRAEFQTIATALGVTLYNHTVRKMSEPMMDALRAASVDIQSVITSAGEDWINELRRDSE